MVEFNADLGWFQSTNGPGSSRPSFFNSFGDMLKALEPSWASREIEPAVIVPWEPSGQSMDVGREDGGTQAATDPSRWTLATSPPLAPPLPFCPSPFTKLSSLFKKTPTRYNATNKPLRKLL